MLLPVRCSCSIKLENMTLHRTLLFCLLTESFTSVHVEVKALSGTHNDFRMTMRWKDPLRCWVLMTPSKLSLASLSKRSKYDLHCLKRLQTYSVCNHLSCSAWLRARSSFCSASRCNATFSSFFLMVSCTLRRSIWAFAVLASATPRKNPNYFSAAAR